MNTLRLACALLASSVTAQQSFVVPSRLASRAGNSWDRYVFHGTPTQQPTRVQLIYNVGDIAPVAAAITGMRFRRPNCVRYANPAGTASLSVTMSVGPNDAASSGASFAANHGATTTSVFSGSVNLPADVWTGPGPAAFLVTIPFATSFGYAASAGRALVADVQIASYHPAIAKESWYLDELAFDPGTREDNPAPQSRCRFSNGSFHNVISDVGTTLVPGGKWDVQYQNLLPWAVGLGAIGNEGVGGMWGAIPLPFDLGPLGAPGCSWNVSVVQVVLLVADGSGTAPWPVFQIPNDRRVVDAVFFDHAAFIDFAANPARTVTTWSSKWTIGTGAYPEGAKVLATRGNVTRTGTKTREAIAVEFSY